MQTLLVFPALYAKIAVFFAAASWIAVNHIDNKAEDYPLIKWKYRLLIAVLVLLITEFILQFQYFLKINPNVITSCCGVMFGEKKQRHCKFLAAFPPLPAKILFYSLLPLQLQPA